MAVRIGWVLLIGSLCGAWGAVSFLRVRQMLLEYVIEQRVTEKVKLERMYLHVQADVLAAEQLALVQERLDRAGVELAPPVQPPMRLAAGTDRTE